MKKCCYCGKEGDENEMNYLAGEYSHKECDDKYFTEQEKKIRYFSRKDKFKE